MAVQRLEESYAEERVTHEELDELLHRALTAETQSEPVSALASLPEEHPGTTSTLAVAGGTDPAARRFLQNTRPWSDTTFPDASHSAEASRS
ncbi:DUF1707 domain-containing protein [Streptomyces fodineus]|nr:DUF1707 domain-containing protein [Streptomyces fodineus]